MLKHDTEPNSVALMKTSVKLIIVLITGLVLTLGSCQLDEEIDIPGGNDDNITRLLGKWGVSDNALKLNYEVAVERDPSNSTQVVLRNFAGSGSAAKALVVGSSLVVEDQVVGSNWLVSGSGVYRKIPLEDLAYAKNLSMDELLNEIESIVASGTKIDISYYINDYVDEYHQEEIYDYFHEAESDSIEKALLALGESEYTEEEIRLMRIKFMSEIGN